jgi:hypothetical protein
MHGFINSTYFNNDLINALINKLIHAAAAALRARVCVRCVLPGRYYIDSYCMCPLTTTYVSVCFYVCVRCLLPGRYYIDSTHTACVLLLPHTCPYASIYVSSCYYI